MKEHPILMSDAMVCALLDGTKTQTRRIIKPRHSGVICGPAAEPGFAIEQWGGGSWSCAVHTECLPCPYGFSGDRLWIKETFYTSFIHDEEKPIRETSPIFYCAGSRGCKKLSGGRTRPSIFLPRWASRIIRDIVEVRVQQVQDITEEDAVAEGVMTWAEACCAKGNPRDLSAIGYYEILWNSINGQNSWNENPWIWAITLRTP